jgi:hypothetical protein
VTAVRARFVAGLLLVAPAAWAREPATPSAQPSTLDLAKNCSRNEATRHAIAISPAQ